MKKGKTIIAISTIIWVIILTVTLFTDNPYINAALFFFGAMLIVCGLSYGCEEIEKAKKKKEQLK
jgi:hypothetical protein